MKSTLYLKFALLYFFFGFIGFFSIVTLSDTLVENRLRNSATRTLFDNVSLIATTYLPHYFAEEISRRELLTQFSAMSISLGSHIWLIEPDGTLIASATRPPTSLPPLKIENFDPLEIGVGPYMIGTYHGLFPYEVITVQNPVTQDFRINGYLLIHMPLTTITHQTGLIMRIIYLTFGIIYLFSFIILMGFHFLIYRPLRNITEAATQYAGGNLDHNITFTTTDEMGYLSASLNYMSNQLRDMKDYQKHIVANVSHDFRSPLTSVKGYVEAMADGTIPPELHGKYLQIILFETNRLTELTRDLLSLNEMDSREFLLNRKDFELQQEIKKVTASFEAYATNKRISIELLLLPEKIFVHADQGKIQQVLHNLIDNALKFSDNESSITIEVVRKYDKAYVSVKDYGVGIPKKEISKVWERFYKSDFSRGKDKKGTGLGLAIVKEIIQAHDENITLVSTEGVGTEFTFSINVK
jgi:signal transduction histidine kinase